MMRGGNHIAIMQPYFLPYLGYWQLISCVETFVVYDDIEFTKKGWIHRNRYLNHGKDQLFTLPLKKDSDYVDIVQRELADSWSKERLKLIRKVEGAYKKAPYFKEGMNIFQECLSCNEKNLFGFILNSIKVVGGRLGIDTDLVISSEIGSTKGLKGQDRVISICKNLGMTEYVNPIGGRGIYSKEKFAKEGLNLKFHKMNNVVYEQIGSDFFANLSILDLLMFVGVEGVKRQLSNFEIH